jgi:TolB protein
VTGGLLLAASGTDRLDPLLGIGRGPGPTAELYLVAVDGPGPTRLTAEPGVLHWGPAWSPDGRTLAYTLARPPAPGELVLADPDGTRRRPLAAGQAFGYLPAWSPDGARLAFIAQAGGGAATAELAVVDADGGHLRRLTANAAQEYGASWAPDGRRLAFGSRQDGTWRVYVLDADGAEGADPRPVAGTEQGNAPAWSPDGRTIAFTSDRTGNDNIYVVAAAGGAARRLTTGPRHHDNAVWSPDGRRLAFNSDRDGGANDLFVMDADGGNLRNLTRTPDLAEVVAAWSPDGQRLVVAAHPLRRAGLWPVPVLRAGGVGLLAGLTAALVLRRRARAGAVVVSPGFVRGGPSA